MTATPEQVDTARAIVLLAAKLDTLPTRLRDYASGLIIGWASPEQADALADALEETARQIRLNRPRFVLTME
ncbi:MULTISPECIES: hypothetical protein [Actinokineospora]|uniref:Uncharacterized protein n=3 Tax=Actinokineospora TaxID=39845 RepID=A0A9W6QQF9_9PSEU|nr:MULTISPECIES: hypothetical protein [Actinokineospora]MCP2300597.1 hypothetical protein [Actinokineospora globicatena]RLK54482.1 hypothetical protein CLV68_5514 [Actinokineospora cianjurensis]SES11411.1 hypothetical protein SAMN04487818_107395 [Actinokineospora terrae]GLW81141.1 hypothetical protein Aglo01_56220 [Actinokineospora globicatena]GLW88334.1 hypothetical protein Aglo02_59730 [Actinokineospora globicatena]